MKSTPSLGSSYKRRWRTKLVRKWRAEQEGCHLGPDALVVQAAKQELSEARSMVGGRSSGYQKSREQIFFFFLSLTIYFPFPFLLSAYPSREQVQVRTIRKARLD